MSSKNTLSQITIEIPVVDLKKMKAYAKSQGQTITEAIMQSVRDHMLCKSKVPNKTTLKSMENARKRIGLTEVKNTKELLKKIGV